MRTEPISQNPGRGTLLAVLVGVLITTLVVVRPAFSQQCVHEVVNGGPPNLTPLFESLEQCTENGATVSSEITTSAYINQGTEVRTGAVAYTTASCIIRY